MHWGPKFLKMLPNTAKVIYIPELEKPSHLKNSKIL